MADQCVHNVSQEAAILTQEWETDPRWKGVTRRYTAEQVISLRGSIKEQNVLATNGAQKLWKLVNGGAKKGYVNALGALSGGQAVQMAKAGLEAIYLSGWQVAADNNTSLQMYPDQSLYAYDSVPRLIRYINNSFRRADQIQWAHMVQEKDILKPIDYFLPIVADAEAGFGGTLNTYELVRNMIDAGASGIHLEDQLAAAKKCGHLGGKVLVPTCEAIDKLIAARLAADVAGVPTVIVGRTDAFGASLLTSDFDSRDKKFVTGERTCEGLFYVNSGIDQAIDRALSYAPYVDVVWCETSTPDINDAQRFADAVHSKFPGKPLAYNCSPSFNWSSNLSADEVASFQQKLGQMNYTFQFITLAGIHSTWYNIFNLAYHYAKGEGMKHYVDLVQKPEFEAQSKGYTFVRHQQEVGVGYFDQLQSVINGGATSTAALSGSTENAQFSSHL